MVGMSDFPIAAPNEILPGIWLGDREDALNWSEREEPCGIVTVHEDLRDKIPKAHAIPIMVGHFVEVKPAYPGLKAKPQWFVDYASEAMLDAATSVMKHYQDHGIPVLVHCWAGVERSPLTMAWFLVRYGHVKTLNEAYETIRAKRPIVEDRQHWLRNRYWEERAKNGS